MKPFAYATAHSTASARELVAGNGLYLAGGNDLLGLLKEYLVGADLLVKGRIIPTRTGVALAAMSGSRR